MHVRGMLFGLYALLAGAGMLVWRPGGAVAETAPAGAKGETGQVTVIPGNPASEQPPTIDLRNALPLPLPSTNSPPPANNDRAAPQPKDTTGTSSPGSHGSGEQHIQVVPDR
jgi:hypothetical protein